MERKTKKRVNEQKGNVSFIENQVKDKNLEDGELDESELENDDDNPKTSNDNKPDRKVTIVRKKISNAYLNENLQKISNDERSEISRSSTQSSSSSTTWTGIKTRSQTQSPTPSFSLDHSGIPGRSQFPQKKQS